MIGDAEPTRVHVSRSYMGGPGWGQVNVWVTNRQLGLWRPGVDEMSDSWTRIEDPAVHVPPSIRLDEFVARELLDALGDFFGGTGLVRTMRADLEHERKRVDKALDALIDMTKQAR